MVLLHLLRCQRFLWRGLVDRARVSHALYGTAPIPADVATSVVPVPAMRRVAAAIAGGEGDTGGSAAAAVPAAFKGSGAVRGVVWPWMRRLPPDPAFGRFIAQPITVPLRCGLRMVDELGHVNNAKYLEITEFARWHQIAFLGLGHAMMERKVAFVVSDLSITYQREIKPFSKVWVRTRFVLPPEAPPTPTPAAAADAADAGEKAAGGGAAVRANTAAVTDKKRFFVEHEIWSADGHKLHAALTLAAALLGPVAYEQELAQRYGSGAAAPGSPSTPQRPRTTLNCEQALADVCGLATTAEVRELFASVGHVCAHAAEGKAAAEAAEDAERSDRIRTLARIWKASRSVLRGKSLIPKPTKKE